MAWFEDAAELRADIAELQEAVEAQEGLPAASRVTALSALVNAKAALLAVETFHGSRDGILYDGIGPLTAALKGFPEPANQLAAALRRLPDR